MSKTPEEQAAELEEAKKRAAIDANRRKLMYADAEMDIIRKEKQMEAVKIFCMLVQKYTISGEDIYELLENVLFI
jgi:hypothetical protein